MPRSSPSSGVSAYSPALAWTSLFGGIWVFVLVTLGAFTTSIGAGMAFPDWPLSNGSLNPKGWLENLAMFAEHSHRLSAGFMTVITLVVAVLVWRKDQRRWLRRLAAGALILIVLQAVVGGLRVLLERQQIVEWETTVGRLFAMLHACLAQLFVCVMAGIAAATSRPWVSSTLAADSQAVNLRKLSRFFCGLLLVQLAVAAVMRHSFAGMAIPTFPQSSATGAWLPEQWDFRVGIHFAHRCLAVLIAGGALWFATAAVRAPALPLLLKAGAVALVVLVLIQASLGALVVLNGRNPELATAHVFVGAVLLASTFLVSWTLHRPVLERSSIHAKELRAIEASTLEFRQA